MKRKERGIARSDPALAYLARVDSRAFRGEAFHKVGIGSYALASSHDDFVVERRHDDSSEIGHGTGGYPEMANALDGFVVEVDISLSLIVRELGKNIFARGNDSDKKRSIPGQPRRKLSEDVLPLDGCDTGLGFNVLLDAYRVELGDSPRVAGD